MAQDWSLSIYATINTWVFDLDNTLYPPTADLFSQISDRMARFIAEEIGTTPTRAATLRDRWWQRHGTTLRGMMEDHQIDPVAFLNYSHDIDYGALSGDAELHDAIAALPGRRIIHTNGPRRHADAVLGALGFGALFDEIYAIEDTGFEPKPKAGAHRAVIDLSAIDPPRAAMIEDDPRNLAIPKALAMTTIWQDNAATLQTPAHVDLRTSRLADLLNGLR